MKEFLEKLMSDNDNDKNFTKFEMVFYGIIIPSSLVLVMGVAGWLESLC